MRLSEQIICFGNLPQFHAVFRIMISFRSSKSLSNVSGKSSMRARRWSSKLNIFFWGTIFSVPYRSKRIIRKFSTFSDGAFFRRCLFWKKNISIFSNLNYFEFCKQKKKKRVLDNRKKKKMMKNLKILVWFNSQELKF